MKPSTPPAAPIPAPVPNPAPVPTALPPLQPVTKPQQSTQPTQPTLPQPAKPSQPAAPPKPSPLPLPLPPVPVPNPVLNPVKPPIPVPIPAPPAPKPQVLKPKVRALLIGNNYPNSSCPLQGCINDVIDMAAFLLSQGWTKEQIQIKPEASKLAMVSELYELALRSWSEPLDYAYIHYSGHGTQVNDTNGDEPDNLDEALCPTDYPTAGMVTDDLLNSIICNQFNPKTQVRVVFDACHSGSCLDLPYEYKTDLGICTSKIVTPCNVQLISGCQDTQTSADASYGGRASGAMTTHLVQVIRAKPTATSLEILGGIHRLFVDEQNPQYPILSSAKPAASEPFFMHA